MSTDPIATINARKFDGRIHRTWKAELVNEDFPLLIFVGEFTEEINHSNLGVIGCGTVSYEYYWLDRWFNVFRFHNKNGDLRNFYCNINMPPTFENSVLDYIDLDIDVLVWEDFSFEILDLEEFEENAEKYNYPEELKMKAQKSLEELTEMINKRAFPFDFQTTGN